MKLFKKLMSIMLASALILSICAVGASAATKKAQYLLIGDSIAYGQGIANSTEACYGRIVADTEGYAYTNDAVSGITSDALLLLLSDNLVAADVKKADIIEISIGGNDFLTQNWVWMGLKGIITGDYSDFDEIAASLAENFAKIISKIRSMNPDAVIIVQTVYNPHTDMWQEAFQEGVDRLNAVFTEYAKAHKNSILIADVGSVISGHSDYIAIDTIHPNAAGNIAIAKYLLTFLKAEGLGTKTEPVISIEPIDTTGFGFTYWLSYVLYGLRLTDRVINVL